jgi:hypothetical protein
MDVKLEDLKELKGVMPEPWLNWILGFVALVSVFKFFIEPLSSLVKFAKDLSPTKISKKSKQEILEECLEKTDYIDKKVLEHCKELKDIELFYKMTRIKCKKNLRDGLIWFHDKTSSKFSWEFIRPAIPYLHERAGNFYVCVPLFDRIYWFFNLFTIVYTSLFMSLIMMLASYSKPKGNVGFLVFIFIVIPLFLMIFALWQTTLPVTRADMISKEVNRIKGVLNRGKNRKNYIKILFLILNRFHKFMLLFFKYFIDRW